MLRKRRKPRTAETAIVRGLCVLS